MAFQTNRIQIDGSINIDGSVYQWNDLFANSGGNVTAGNQADNQVAVWNATAKQIEGTAGLTYNGTTLGVTGELTTTDNITLNNTGTAIMNINSTTDNAYLYIDSNKDGAGTEVSGIVFQDEDDSKWQIGKNDTNDFRIYDYAKGGEVLNIEGDGDMNIYTDVDVNGTISYNALKPIQIVNSTASYYKLGTLSGTGARVRIKITGQNGFSVADSYITEGVVSIGNSDNEYDAWQYTYGNSIFTIPTIIYKDAGDTSVDVYLLAGSYFRGSVEIVNSYGFVANSTATTPVSNPAGVNASDEYNIKSEINTTENITVDKTSDIQIRYNSARNTFMYLNSDTDDTSTARSEIAFQDEGSSKYIMGKNLDGTFRIYDYARPGNVLEVEPDGDMYLMPSGGKVIIGGSVSTYSGSLVGSGNIDISLPVGSYMVTAGVTNYLASNGEEFEYIHAIVSITVNTTATQTDTASNVIGSNGFTITSSGTPGATTYPLRISGGITSRTTDWSILRLV